MILGLALWLAAVAQLAYVPVWAGRLGRSSATWFMLTVIWSGGWVLGGGAYMIGFATLDLLTDAWGARAPHILTWIGIGIGLLSLLPTFVLAVAGRGRSADPSARWKPRAQRKGARTRPYGARHYRFKPRRRA